MIMTIVALLAACQPYADVFGDYPAPTPDVLPGVWNQPGITVDGGAFAERRLRFHDDFQVDVALKCTGGGLVDFVYAGKTTDWTREPEMLILGDTLRLEARHEDSRGVYYCFWGGAATVWTYRLDGYAMDLANQETGEIYTFTKVGDLPTGD